MKGGVKTVEWTEPLGELPLAVRNVAPESSPLGRAAALVRLGSKQGTQKDIFETRCERGADIARELGFPEATAAAIRSLDEHWDGRGQPLGLRGDEIPVLARIVCLAQSLDVFLTTHGVEAAYRMARERHGTWFDPAMVRRSSRSSTIAASGPASLRMTSMDWSPRSSLWITSSGSTSRGSTESPAPSPG